MKDLWWHRAACLGVPLEVFYPEGKGASLKTAREICGGCPVSVECFEDMSAYEESGARHGFWGNTSRDERNGKAPKPRVIPTCVHGNPTRDCVSCYEDRVADYHSRGECSYGHELTLENIVASAEGYPQCRQCRKDRAREFRERKKAC